ncbi:hypothetical protein QFW80_00110 [Luteimonas sp. M1R5S18]|uniref:DUF7832 domain-containing protein n=1 Tax=Luteimonas rhizosphaericola TaxID=3042024 RepID=A0ABT6JED2_9GAMM|nr:hypothetical protein [Luteimonas rhizosphaericola]MDH5828927.1 hypothetical protein [Luteimonas rhizosphaericola]
MKYDDASWHYGGEFPSDLPDEAGATHTGMYVAWALLSGLAGDIHIIDYPEDIQRLQERSVTPGAFFLSACDGKFTNEDLTDEGNAFTSWYFDFEKGQYLADYEATFGQSLPEGPNSLYYVTDSWDSFDKLRPVLDMRLLEWRSPAG